MCGRERQKEKENVCERETDRQTNGKIERQTDRQIKRERHVHKVLRNIPLLCSL